MSLIQEFLTSKNTIDSVSKILEAINSTNSDKDLLNNFLYDLDSRKPMTLVIG